MTENVRLVYKKIFNILLFQKIDDGTMKRVKEMFKTMKKSFTDKKYVITHTCMISDDIYISKKYVDGKDNYKYLSSVIFKYINITLPTCDVVNILVNKMNIKQIGINKDHEVIIKMKDGNKFIIPTVINDYAVIGICSDDDIDHETCNFVDL